MSSNVHKYQNIVKLGWKHVFRITHLTDCQGQGRTLAKLPFQKGWIFIFVYFLCNCGFVYFYLLVYLCRSCTWPSLLPYRQHRQRHEQDQNGPRSHCARLCQVIPQSQNWPQKWNVQISIWLRSYEIPPHNGLYSFHSAFFVSFLDYCISRRCKRLANMLGVNYGTAHSRSDWFFSVV